MRKVNKKNCFSGGGTSYNPQTLQSPYLQTDFSKQLPTQLTAPASVQQYAPGNYNPGSSANPLFGSKVQNLFGGASAGGQGIGGIGQAGDAINSMIGNVTAPATATTKGEANMQTVTNTIGGAAKGAAAGFAVGGPVGAIVGGVAGLASGITGNKGKVNLQSNPYDDNITVNYGTGIRGGKRIEERQRDKETKLQLMLEVIRLVWLWVIRMNRNSIKTTIQIYRQWLTEVQLVVWRMQMMERYSILHKEIQLMYQKKVNQQIVIWLTYQKVLEYLVIREKYREVKKRLHRWVKD